MENMIKMNNSNDAADVINLESKDKFIKISKMSINENNKAMTIEIEVSKKLPKKTTNISYEFKKKARITHIEYNPYPLHFILQIDGIFLDKLNDSIGISQTIIKYNMYHSLHFDSIRLLMSNITKSVPNIKDIINKIIIIHYYYDYNHKENIIYDLSLDCIS